MRAGWDKYYAKFRAAEKQAGLRRCHELRIIIRFALDEFGYVPFDVDGARLLYQVISESYERRAIIFTTNIEFSKWGTVFADDKLAQAIVDRVVHHGRLIEYAGPSHRLENSLMLGRGGVVA